VSSERRSRSSAGARSTPGAAASGTPGKTTLVQRMPRVAAVRPPDAAPVAPVGPVADDADTDHWTYGLARHERPVVQRRAADPAAADDTVPAVAAAGVAGAGQALPHLEALRPQFGRHAAVLDGARAHVGGAAAEASAAIGAHAYTTGTDVAFADAPDLGLAAHEAAHLVQQRAGVQLQGGVGAAGDPYEQHADRVAAEVTAGRSAEHVLDEMAAAPGGSVPAVQRQAAPVYGNAAFYIDSNSHDLVAALTGHLQAIDFPAPDPRLEWQAQGEFRRELLVAMARFLGGLNEPTNLQNLCFPSDALRVVDQLRPMAGQRKGTPDAPAHDDPHVGGAVGSLDWAPAIGTAVGHLLEAQIHASLRRLGPRYVAAADEGISDEARLDERVALVPFERLVTSHPMDRLVGRAITSSAVFTVHDPAAGSASKPARSTALRPVKLEWQGSDRTPTLWNWVRAVEPADATVEEVAAALYPKTAERLGESSSWLAYSLTAAPPLFGVPPAAARQFAAARDHAPPEGTDGDLPRADRVLTVATGAIGSEIALAQASDEAAPPAASDGADPTLDLVADCRHQLVYVITALAPWSLAMPAVLALIQLETAQARLFTASAEERASWARVLAGQRANLQQIGGAIHAVTEKAGQLGAAGPDDGNAAFTPVLAAYARAAGASHLIDTCRDLIALAAGEQAQLALRAVEGSARNMSSALDILREDSSGGERLDLSRQGNDIEGEARAMQSALIAGAPVDGVQLDLLTLRADTLALRARVVEAQSQLENLRAAADSADDGFFAELSAAFSSEFSSVEGTCEYISARLTGALYAMEQEVTTQTLGWEIEPGKMDAYYASERQLRRQALATAQAQFQQITVNEKLGDFLRHGASLVRWQVFRTACLKLAALIGVSMVGSFAGGLAARAVGGVMMRIGGAATVAELSTVGRMVVGAGRFTANVAADAAVNALGQSALDGTSFGKAFATNAITTVGSMAILGALARDADQLVKVQDEAAGMWQKVGRGAKVVLTEGATIVGHGVMGAALGYVASKIVTGEAEPSPETLEEWLMQGASIAVGRYVQKGVEAHLGNLRKVSSLDGLLQRSLALHELAIKAQKNPTAHDALELMWKRNDLLHEEVRALDTLAKDPHAMAEGGLKLKDVRAMQGELHQQIQDVHGQAFSDLPLHLSGLDELVPGAVWRGTRTQIEDAVHAAQRAGLETSAVRDEATGRWKVKLGDRTMEIHERGAGASADAARSDSGAVTLAGVDDDARRVALWVPRQPGTLDVIVHGAVDGFEVRTGPDTWVTLSHRSLARYIAKAGSNATKIRLLSCNTGVHPRGAAQHLANKTGLPVEAPTDKLHIFSDGRMIIGPTDDRPTGSWQTFEPGPSSLRYSAYREPAPMNAAERYWARKRAAADDDAGGAVDVVEPAAVRDGAAGVADRPTRDAVTLGNDEPPAHLVQALGDATLAGLRGRLDVARIEAHVNAIGADLKRLVTELGPDTYAALARDLDGPAIQRLAGDLGAGTVRDLAARLPATALRDLHAALGKDVVARYVGSLGADGVAAIAGSGSAARFGDYSSTLGPDMVEALGAHALTELAPHLSADDVASLVTTPDLALPYVRALAETPGAGAALHGAIAHFQSADAAGVVVSHAQAGGADAAGLLIFLQHAPVHRWRQLPAIQKFFQYGGVSGHTWADLVDFGTRLGPPGTPVNPAFGGRTVAAAIGTVPNVPCHDAAGNAVTITFTTDDARHVASRHTWRGFAQTPGNAKPTQGMLPAHMGIGDVTAIGVAILANPAFPAIVAGTAPGTSNVGTISEAGFLFEVRVSLQNGVDGMVSYYPLAGPGVDVVSRDGMRAAIWLFQSR
jgi:hypothetical protein